MTDLPPSRLWLVRAPSVPCSACGIYAGMLVEIADGEATLCLRCVSEAARAIAIEPEAYTLRQWTPARARRRATEPVRLRLDYATHGRKETQPDGHPE